MKGLNYIVYSENTRNQLIITDYRASKTSPGVGEQATQSSTCTYQSVEAFNSFNAIVTQVQLFQHNQALQILNLQQSIALQHIQHTHYNTLTLTYTYIGWLYLLAETKV